MLFIAWERRLFLRGKWLNLEFAAIPTPQFPNWDNQPLAAQIAGGKGINEHLTTVRCLLSTMPDNRKTGTGTRNEAHSDTNSTLKFRHCIGDNNVGQCCTALPLGHHLYLNFTYGVSKYSKAFLDINLAYCTLQRIVPSVLKSVIPPHPSSMPPL